MLTYESAEKLLCHYGQSKGFSPSYVSDLLEQAVSLAPTLPEAVMAVRKLLISLDIFTTFAESTHVC